MAARFSRATDLDFERQGETDSTHVTLWKEGSSRTKLYRGSSLLLLSLYCGSKRERTEKAARWEKQMELALRVRIVLFIETLGKKVVEIVSLLLWASLHVHRSCIKLSQETKKALSLLQILQSFFSPLTTRELTGEQYAVFVFIMIDIQLCCYSFIGQCSTCLCHTVFMCFERVVREFSGGCSKGVSSI